MKVVKAKYYEESGEIIPLDPQPTLRVNGVLQYDRKGTDEKGEFVVIDFISEEATYFEYEADNSGKEASDFKITTEEEWSKPATQNTENMASLLLNDVDTVNVSTLEKSSTTNTKMNLATSRMAIGNLIQTIVQRCLNALDVVISIFRK